MLSHTAIAFGLFFSSITAAVIPNQSARVTIALSNDQSGAYSTRYVAADGVTRRIYDLFRQTSVGSSGSVLASSTQLTAFPQSISCIIRNNGVTIATLTAQRTYADLDGNPNSLSVVNLNRAVLTCNA
ncbi:hypothetical protein BJX63DRAFT_379527 [Aspergillus granulosus]|uniref:Uncharacterized protein n=1 Tax=Aspergillus granulosus TaxID=176169 RepID=A0ABR4I096_9EURO